MTKKTLMTSYRNWGETKENACMNTKPAIANKKSELADLFRKKGLEMQPISHIQSNIWFQSQLNPDLNVAYNLRRGFLISGRLAIEKLGSAVRQVIKQHPALRTIFMEVGGSPVKLVQTQVPAFELKPEVFKGSENELPQWLQQDADQPFHFGQEYLYRFKVYQINENQFAFLMVMHHIICDGYAMDLLLRAISKGYHGELSNESYPSSILHDTTHTTSDETLRYWKESLSSYPKLHNLPLDHTRPATLSYRGAKVTQTFDRSLTEQINRYCQKANLTPFVVLMSVWSILLSKLSGEKKVVLGFPLSTRNETNQNTIDLLVDTLPLGIDVAPKHTFAAHAQSVRSHFFQAYENRQVSFFELSEHLKLERNLSYHPVYQLAFTFLENKQQLSLADTAIKEIQVSKSRIKMDLEFHMELDHEKNYRCNVHFNTSLFESTTIDQYINRFTTLITTCLSSPEQSIQQLSIVGPVEEKQLLQYAKGRVLEIPKVAVHQVFEQQLPQVEDKVALIYKSQKISYQTLNEKANQLAHLLLEKANQESFIGLLLNPGVETIIGMLGVMKAGKAYVPIDPAYPAKRIGFILKNSGISTLLSNLSISHVDVKYRFTFKDPEGYPTDNPEISVSHDDLIYMIYTSGTTGVPKGVPITHRGILNYTWSRIDQQKITKKDIALQLMSFSFDGFGCEVFPALLTGGTLVLVDKLADMEQLSDIGASMVQHEVTRFMAVPSTLKLILDHLQSTDLQHLHTISLGGEKPDQELLEKIAQLKPDVHLFNEYGPTENSIASTSGPLDFDSPENIGIPTANALAVILDADENLVPVGVPGELCVGGPGLTSGYFKQPDLTAAKNFTSTLLHGKQLYRTGDLTKWDAAGNIHYLGRSDDQVKINGVRIELGEIRQTLLDFHGIEDCLVLEHQATLEAILQSTDLQISIQDISAFLGEQLPHFMIPTSYRIIDQFPVTAHGKIDLEALQALSNPLIPSVQEEVMIDQALVEQLKNAWAKVLQLDPLQIDIKSNFFDLGGHSLLLGKLVSVINKTTDLSVEKVDFFKYPSIQALVQAKSDDNSSSKEVHSRASSRAEKRKSQRNRRLNRQH